MAKKRNNRSRYDDDDEDYDEDNINTGGGKPGDAQPAIVYNIAVQNFMDEYECVPSEFEADVVMDIEKQRDYFEAWPQLGGEDPLPVYVRMLEQVGYYRKKNFAGESCYFLREKIAGVSG